MKHPLYALNRSIRNSETEIILIQLIPFILRERVQKFALINIVSIVNTT